MENIWFFKFIAWIVFIGIGAYSNGVKISNDKNSTSSIVAAVLYIVLAAYFGGQIAFVE